MTSQGQRFRRRALRRGYKVDEVDSFLDRVEATLNGTAGGATVAAQEVHDVVFRVRFGGYDEWQVDLHLDRVERQLTELEEQGGGRIPEARTGETRLPPERMAPDRMAPDRMGPGAGMPPPAERLAPGMERERMGAASMDRMGPPTVQVPPVPAGPPVASGRPPAAGPGPSAPPREPVYGGGRYDEPPYDGGYEPGRHGRADMTTEIRMPPDPGFGGQPPRGGGGQPGGFGGQPGYGAPSGFGNPPGPGGGQGYPGPGPSGPMGPGPSGPMGPGPMGAPGGAGLTGDAARADQLRRTFQLRRFGSGYDRTQVDRLFDTVVAALAGRGPVGVSDADLDPGQFALVPGGYFEAEVNAALREVRDLLARRR